MPKVIDLETEDIIGARCTYDSSERNTTTYFGKNSIANLRGGIERVIEQKTFKTGSTAGDEMCNLYMMYYTDAQRGSTYQTCTDSCGMENFFPPDSDVPLPPNPSLEEHAIHGNHGQENGTIKISDKMSINLVSL